MEKIFGVLLLTTTLLFSGITFAAQSSEAGALVQSTADKLLSTIKEERSKIERDSQHVYRLVDQIVLPHFDFPLMAKRVLGKYWRNATPQQRKDFTQVFRDLLVRTYANSLTEYTDQTITYFPVRETKDASRVTVRSEVELASGTPVELAYALALNNDKWKVYDITIDGVSLVTNYRSSFSREIDQEGIDSLIKKLEEKNKQGEDLSE